jgi:MFS family permease
MAIWITISFYSIIAPNWGSVIFANVLLGINQGLAWSMTVNMKIDLVGRERRGLALGINEFAGYLLVGIIGFLTGYLASTFGLKPFPFYPGIAFALLGLLISWFLVRDTKKFTLFEIKENEKEKEFTRTTIRSEGTTETTRGSTDKNSEHLSFIQVFAQTS